MSRSTDPFISRRAPRVNGIDRIGQYSANVWQLEFPFSPWTKPRLLIRSFRRQRSGPPCLSSRTKFNCCFKLRSSSFGSEDEGFLDHIRPPWRLTCANNVTLTVSLFGMHLRRSRETRFAKEAEELLNLDANPAILPHVMARTSCPCSRPLAGVAFEKPSLQPRQAAETSRS